MNEFERYIKQLESPTKNARASAAYKLGLLGNSAAIDWLEKSITDPYLIVRCRSIHALSHFQEPKAIALLTSALNDPEDEVYGCTTTALAKIGNEQAIAILINEVLRQEYRRRNIAAYKLIMIGRPALPALRNAFYTSSGKPRASFLMALGRIGNKECLDEFRQAILDEDYEVFWVATAIYRVIDDPLVVPLLIDSLEHEDLLRQARAANTLWYVGDQRAIETLTRVIADKDRNETIRSAAYSTLAKLTQTEPDMNS